MSLAPYTSRISAGEHLSRQEIRTAFVGIMDGREHEDELVSFLRALHDRGETAEEIAGAADALRSHMTKLPTDRPLIVDTCGTGGTGSEIFNVSTAAAIVAAAAGIAVAKHGNRSVTSKSGSSDVLAALGLNLDASVDVVSQCLEELGICFCFAPKFHPAMKNVAAARKKLGSQSIFNLLGPLCNPAGATHQVMGVGRPELRERMAHALQLLGTKRAVIVGGADGCGELSLAGETQVLELTNNEFRVNTWEATDFGLAAAGFETMRIDGPQQSAALIGRIFKGEPGPPRDMVVLNAAAAIWIASDNKSLTECAAIASDAIDSGRAQLLLKAWVARTNAS